MRLTLFRASLLVACLLLVTGTASATSVLQMNLGDLVDNAGKIFRGTVVDVSPGTVTVGGGELPTVTYRLKVEETFKGDFTTDKEEAMVEVTMLGTVKDSSVTVGNASRLGVLPELPTLTKGSDYLLFTTAPSAIGLSTTVGLGQGSFTVFNENKVDMAVNEVENQGLMAGVSGPVLYSDLADAIRARVNQ